MISPEHQEYLSGRGILPETSARFGLFSRDGKIVIPIGNEERVHTPHAKLRKMVWSRTLSDDVPPFPSEDAFVAADVIVEGEFDAMIAIQNGFKAASGTIGSSGFRKEWLDALALPWNDKPRTILYDNDDAGRKGANELARQLSERGVTVKIAYWPSDKPKGFDVTDFFVGGGTALGFRGILDSASTFKLPDSSDGLRGFGEITAYLDEQPVIPTGFKTIDECIYGLRRGEVVVIAARPAVGKSTLAAQIAVNVAKAGLVAGIFSLEMSEPQILERLIASESDVPKFHLERGLWDEDIEKLYRTIPAMWRMPLFIDTQSRLTTQDIEKRAREATPVPDVLVIDYVGLLNMSEKKESRARQLARAMEDLKDLSKELNCVIIVLSQINREGAKDEQEEPQLHQLMESGGVEATADVTIILWRKRKEAKEAIENKLPIPTHGRIAKNRNGPEGYFEFRLMGQTCRFEEVTE